MEFIKKHYWIIICLAILFFILVADSQTQISLSTFTTAPTNTQPVNTPMPAPAYATGTPSPTWTPTVPPITVKPSSLKGVNVTLWYSWTGETRRVFESLINQFNEANSWGIQLTAVQQGDGQALYASLDDLFNNHDMNNLPNLVLASPDQISSINDHSEAIVWLTPYLSDPVVGLSAEEQAAIPDVYWDLERRTKGRISGLPALRTYHVLFYNQSWARELGYAQTPGNQGEFRQQVCAAAKAITASGDQENAGTGGWLINNDPETVLSWMVSFGYNDLPTSEAQSYQFNTLNNQSMLIFLNNLFNSDCAWIGKSDTPEQYFAARQALVVSGQLQEIPALVNAMRHTGSNDEWKILPYPTNEDKKRVVSSGYSYAVIDHNDQANLAAWLVARWLNTAENQARLANAGGWLPTNRQALELTTDFQYEYPQWKDALGWMDNVVTAPSIGTWQTARQVLGDAGWQVFHPKPTPDSPSTVLELLDSTVSDAVQHRP